MYAVVITDEGGARRRLDFSKPELTVGRVNGNDIVLAKRNVSKQHARLSLEQEKAVVVDLNSTNGTWVNGRKITAPHPLKSGDKIYIADFIITLEESAGASEGSRAPDALSEPPAPPPNVPERSLAPKTSRPARPAIPERGRTSRPKAPLPKPSLPPRVEARPTDEAELRGRPAADPLAELMRRLSERLDIDNVDPDAMKNQERWSAARAAIAEIFLAMQKDGSVDADVDMRQVAHTALHEIVGLGALDDVLSNDAVRLAVVNGPGRVLIDTGAGPQPTALSFSSDEALDVVTKRLAAETGRTLGDRPLFHGRLSFGPRVTIMRAPLVTPGPLIEVRIDRPASLDHFVGEAVLSEKAATYLRKAVAECRNVAVIGPFGSGVTAMLSALCAELPGANTIVMEALPDLDVDREKIVALGGADVGMSMQDVIAHGARLAGDHLVINDLASHDVATALSAIGGREPGHLLGIHCASRSNPVDGLVVAASCWGAERARVAELIGSALHVVVGMESSAEGSRIAAILEIEGAEAGDVSYQSVTL